MTSNYVLLLCLMIILSVAFFGPYVDAYGSNMQVAKLSPHAIEVLKENGYDVPMSAITGIPEPAYERVTIGGWDAIFDLVKWVLQSIGWIFALMTFQVENVPMWLNWFVFFPMMYILLWLLLKLARGSEG